MNSSTEIVDDPRYPDRIGVGDSPGIPCKVTEFSVTTASTGAPIDQGPDLNAVYDQLSQYRIRFELPPAKGEQRAREGLDAAIVVKLADRPALEARELSGERARNVNAWMSQAAQALFAVLELHADIEGFGDEGRHCAHCGAREIFPCPTKREIRKALGLGCEVFDA